MASLVKPSNEVFLNGCICDFLEENALGKLSLVFWFIEHVAHRAGKLSPWDLLLPPLPVAFGQIFALHLVLTFLVVFWQSTSASGFLKPSQLRERRVLSA